MKKALNRGKKFCISVADAKITQSFNTTRQVGSFMEKYTRIQSKNKQIIDVIQSSDEQLTSNAGLALFAQNPQSIQLMPIIDGIFGWMRKKMDQQGRKTEGAEDPPQAHLSVDKPVESPKRKIS